MRSRGDARIVAERVSRTVLIGALAVALVRSLMPGTEDRRTLHPDARALTATLASATRSSGVAAIEAEVDSLPSATERAWLVGVRRAGVRVTWTGRPMALAVQAGRSREPDARVRIALVADSGSSIALGDSAGRLDSVRIVPRGGTLVTAAVVGAVRASSGRQGATARVPASRPPRAVLVVGRPGWEGKFVAAALQEAGWSVRTRQVAAPGVVVADPGLLPIDTSRYAVVVVLDTSAADLAAAIARFAGEGGGLVLAGDAPGMPAFAARAPARASARRPGHILFDADSVTRADLPVRPLGAIRGDAVRLEGTPAEPTVAVRRAGLGRVATIAYDDTWRWRMMGGTSGLAAHREWWSHTVGMVAPELAGDSAAAGAEAAPVAALVDALGPPSVRRASPGHPPIASVLPFLLLAIVAALLAETASRRFRGAR